MMSDAQGRLDATFVKALGIDASAVKIDLTYNTIPEWDSLAHMTLVAAIEEEFNIMLDTDDIIDMSSVSKAREILIKYDIEF